MKIRTQNMLAIVPLFLGLSALIGALMYVVQYRELIWGLDEEATSIAVAAARHMHADAIRSAETADDWERIMAIPVRLLDWGRAKRVAILSPDHDVLYDNAADSEARPIVLNPALRARMDDRSFAATPVQQDERGRYMMAFSPIHDDEGTAAILVVETAADALTVFEERIRDDIRTIVVATVLIGIALAWLISRIISRRIVSLTAAASAVGGGQYDQPHEAGGVQEINDLSSTFNTMSSVLSEVVSKTRRAVVEAEQFRTDDDLARAFTETFMPAEHRTVQGVAVSATHVTSRSGGHFFGVWEKGDEAIAVAGEVAGGTGLEAPLKASAAATALRECWQLSDTKQACTEWSALFELTRVHILAWKDGADQLTSGSWDANTQSFVFSSTPWTDQPLFVHTIAERVAHRIQLYVQTFKHLDPHALTDEIKLTLDKQQQGALIIAKRV